MMQMRQEENAMIKTLLFATAAVTALSAAAPASARVRHGATIHYYRGIGDTNDYAWSGPGGTDAVGNRTRSGVRGVYGFVPHNYGSYCNQMPKAC